MRELRVLDRQGGREEEVAKEEEESGWKEEGEAGEAQTGRWL